MDLRSVICVFCVIAASHTSQIPLFPTEAALLDPRSLFGGVPLDFTLNPPESKNAHLLRTAAIAEVSEAQIEGEWHLGPTLSADGDVLITTVTATSVQVWGAEGLELLQLWEGEGPMRSVTPVSTREFVGFVLKDLSQVGALDVRIRPIALQAFSGFDAMDVPRVIVCREAHKAAAFSTSPGHLEIKQYELDYTTMTATSLNSLSIEVESGEVVDGICTSEFFYLQAHRVYYLTNSNIQVIHLPYSASPYTSLKAVPRSNEIYAVNDSGAVLVVKHQLLTIPEVSQVLFISSQTIVTASRLVVYAQEWSHWRLSSSQKILIEIEGGEYQWVSTGESNLLLMKERQSLRLYSVAFDPVQVVLFGTGAPYTVNICSFGTANCLTVSVEPAAGNGESITLRSEMRSSSTGEIAISKPLRGRNLSINLLFTNYLAGVNLNAALSFSNIPPGISVRVYPQFENSADKTLVDLHRSIEPRSEFLCASVISQHVVYRTENVVEIFPTEIEEQVDLLRFDKAKCVFRDKELFIYGEKEGVMWLYRQLNSNIDGKELRKTGDDVLVAMASTRTHIALLFSNKVDILYLKQDRWQTAPAESRYIGLCESGTTLVLLSPGSIEFLVPIGGLYISRAKVALAADMRKCAYSHSSLVLLSGDNTVSVYYVSSSFQLTALYSLSANCSVADIITSAEYGVYRCPDYYQAIGIYSTRYSSAVVRIPIVQEPLLTEVQESSLIDVYVKDRRLVTQKWRIEDKLSYIAGVVLSSGTTASAPVLLLGELNVTSSAGAPRQFPVRITLETNGTIVSLPRETFPSTVELPWGQQFSISPSQYFTGDRLSFSANTSDPAAIVRIQQPVTPVCSLPLTALFNVVAVSIEHNLAITFHSGRLVVIRYVYGGGTCHTASKRSVPLDFFNVMRLEVVFSTEEFVVIYILANALATGTLSESEIALYRLDPHSMRLSLLYSRKYSISLKAHAIKTTDSLCHILLYGDLLLHCVLRGGVYLDCSEVLHTSLYKIEALGSHKLSNDYWELYAFTSSHRLVTLKLTDSTLIVTATSEYITFESLEKALRIVDRFLLIRTENCLLVYSIPALECINRIEAGGPFRLPDSASWTTDTRGQVLITVKDMQSFCILINISSGSVLAKLKSYHCAIASNDTVVSYSDQGLAFLRLAQDWVTVQQGEGDSVDVEVVARNELSERRRRVRVVWAQRSYYGWPACVVGAGLWASLRCREKRRKAVEKKREEVEMQKVEST